MRAVQSRSMSSSSGTALISAFGAADGVTAKWESLVAFDDRQATRLLTLLHTQGYPFVHPGLLRTMVGPESQIGAALIPALFEAVVFNCGQRYNGTEQNHPSIQRVGSPIRAGYGYPHRQTRRFFDSPIPSPPKALQGTHSLLSFFPAHFIAIVAKLVSALAFASCQRGHKRHPCRTQGTHAHT